VASQLTEEVTGHAQSDSLEDAREIGADGTYFPNNLRDIVSWYLLLMKYRKPNITFIPSNVLLWKSEPEHTTGTHFQQNHKPRGTQCAQIASFL